MVGTEVIHVTSCRPSASMKRCVSNCGSSTMLAWAASANLQLASAFMWNIGAATMKRSSSKSLRFRKRERMVQSWPSCDSCTPLRRPVEPEV
ncbi:Uncharacterised protein [Bordetella pertussis]|nr:Uncharacterised protein [Bordetella pertussis]CFO96323.1 Uncharacterised protein [Bordetella pertussis]CFP53577.1 Uncharacterised protein [Bordetella pertussis]CPI82359.1 Uncharacterised protein [Bordetella pertussis]CPO03166.1 Uncharacterised protein [Bordetella pertussis]